jgi:hypothetical protein
LKVSIENLYYISRGKEKWRKTVVHKKFFHGNEHILILREKETNSPNSITSKNKKLIIVTEINLFKCNEKLYQNPIEEK